MIRSAMIPGWGQISNGVSIYRIAKVAAIYTGGTLLTLSFIDNNKNYHQTLDLLKYRQGGSVGPPPPATIYDQVNDNQQLIQAKDTFRRNKEVIIFSLVALYGVNVIEAYIDARLKYFDVYPEIAMKVTPSVLLPTANSAYQQPLPSIKVSLLF
jgi:hypothetical protein